MKIMQRICLALLMFVTLTPCAYGAEDPVSDSFREEWDVFVESIPEEIRPLAEDAFRSANTGEGIKETFSVSYFWDKIVKELKEAWPSSARLLFSLTGLLIFSNEIGRGTVQHTLPDIVHYASDTVCIRGK